jgi:hypothetical protein
VREITAAEAQINWRVHLAKDRRLEVFLIGQDGAA